ncbi:MAG: hypothetical protein HY577_02230 [Candidatus Nealsonbacteria bacterium]|nr:hypothetical protein [Candidatus Nealsonbacteria bacterium]
MVGANLKNFPRWVKISLLVLVFVGLSLPLYQARAFLGPLAGLIAANIFAFALQLVVIITWLILLVCYAILIWVLSPAFITLPYTSGGIVDIGWPITRDLANMGFVFALLVIGVATALRYPRDEGYKVKKALPSLIGIILLVNFTPVITGVIMDAANIVMVFFIQEVSGFQSLITILGNQFSAVVSSFTNLQGILTGQIALIARSLVLIGFNLMTAMFLLLFAVIFIMRYVAIWMLVILSPLAFFAYVLPGTRKYFTAWWSQFLQWAFVGVTAAFFLYLAEQLLVTMSTTPFIAAPTPPIGILQPLTDIFNTVMVYAVIEAFLAFGFFASLSSGAVGAGAVISTGKQWSTAAAKSVGSWAGKTGKGYARKALEESGIAKGAMDIAQRMATMKTPGTGVPGVKGTLQRAAGGVFAEGIRVVGRGGMTFLESGRKEVGEAEGEVEKASVDMVISKFRSAAEWSKKVGYLNRLIKKGDLGDALKKGLTEGEINQALVHAQRYDSHQEILNAMPHLPEAQQIIRRDAAVPRVAAAAAALAISPSAVTPAQMAAVTPAQIAAVTPVQAATARRSLTTTQIGGVTPAQLGDAYRDNVFRKMKPERAGQVSSNIFTDPMLSEAAIRGWDGRHVGKFVETQGQAAMQSIEDTIDRLTPPTPVNVGHVRAAAAALATGARTPIEIVAVTPADISKITPDQITAMIPSLTPAQIAAVNLNQVAALTPDQLSRSIDRKLWLETNNPRLRQYLQSSVARTLGFTTV